MKLILILFFITVPLVAQTAHFKDPAPIVDVRAHGARPVNLNLAPAIPGITATINSGSSSATLSAASTFQNGDGVAIVGAGATHAMTTPAAPTLSNGLAKAPTGTGLVVPGGTGAVNTRCYKIVARNKAQGLTAASPETCIVNGQTTLGAVTINITSMSRSGTTVTAVTSPHTLPTCTAAGSVTCGVVFIQGTSDDNNFGGWFPLASVGSATNFTFNGTLSSVNGATTSAIGGTFTYYQSDHLVLPPYGAGMWQYGIYEGTMGAETLVGVSLPNVATYSNDPTALMWDYYGSTYSGGFTPSYFWPNTPPSVAVPDTLSTTIVRGAGTTVLTLANAASNSVAASQILFDDGPAFALANASVTCTNGCGGYMHIPPPVNTPGVSLGYPINTYLTLGGAVSQSAYIVLNDTLQLSGIWRGDLSPNPTSSTLPQFGLEALTQVSIPRATPGFYLTNGAGLRGINITVSGNNYIGVLYSTGASAIFEHLSFSGGGPGDYNGILFYDFEDAVAGGFGFKFNDVSLVSGPGSAAGTSFTPLFVSKNNGEMNFDYVSCAHRGFFFRPTPMGLEIDFKQGEETQGLTMPLMSFQFQGGVVSGWVHMKNTILDTAAQPLLANFAFGNALGVQVSIDGSNAASGLSPTISGAAFAFVRAHEFLGTISQLGQNFNVEFASASNSTVSGISYYGNRTISLLGTGKVGAGQIPTPTFAPIVSVTTVGCTQFPTAGTYTYAIFAVDATGVVSSGVGGSTPVGPASSGVVLNGTTQCTQITQPTLPLGAVYWGAAAVSGPATGSVFARNGSVCGFSFIPITITTFKDDSVGKCAQPNNFNSSNLHIMQPTGYFGIATTAREFTEGQCFSAASPAVCGDFIDGVVTIAAGGPTTVVVNTSQVTANSNIQLTFDTTKGGQLAVTCNTTAQLSYVSAISPGVSFTISVPAPFTTNPGCISYHYKN